MPDSLQPGQASERPATAARAPRVSIILNVRNGEAYVREALESVVAQTFGDWELIFWDNASTDSTPQIFDSFGDARMCYFRSPEVVPLGHARNFAIREARGEWLAFLDHDDVWLPEKLALQMALDDPAVGIIYGRAVSFAISGHERDFDRRREYGPLPQGLVFERLFAESCFIAMSSAVLRRSAVVAIGEVPEWVHLITDYYLHLELARRYRVRAVQRVVCRYRLHPASLSFTQGTRVHYEALRLIDQWAPTVSAELVAERRRVHSTALAVEEMRRPGLRISGLLRLLREGSVLFLVTRPPVWAYRALRRRIYRPIWTQDGLEPVWRGAPAEVDDAPLKLSVIVVNWKVRELLRECLTSLHDQMQLARKDYEVIVVDNNSRDGSIEMVRAEFPEARLIVNEENVGFGRANDAAFRVCHGRYVLLLNPDTVVLDNAVDRMMEIMEARPDLGALGCRLLNSDGSFQRWTGGNPPRVLNVACNFLLLNRILPEALQPPPLYLEREPSQDVEVGWVSGACMLLRRAAILTTIFDERFFLYGEDVELCERLNLGEWKVVYTPHARIIHHQGKSLEHQTVKIQHAKMRGLRTAFAMRNSPALVPVYDFLLMVGFLIRTVIFGAAAVLRPGRGYAARAGASRRFMADAFWALLGR